jgi:rhamnosyltransferase
MKSMNTPHSVLAVVVTYRCGRGVLPTLEALRPQVDRIIVVDNGGDAETRTTVEEAASRSATVETIFNPKNLGIAGGLNVGVHRALELGSDWILTMDHDSVPSPDMVVRLLDAWKEHPDKDQVAIVAPRHFDARTGREGIYPIYGKGLRARHPAFGPHTAFIEPTEVISSGSLIRSRVFGDVGFFDERLFIDSVDVDFCLRLARAGYRILVPREATMKHELGKGAEESFAGIGMTVSHHPEFRRYYIVRNRLHLGIRYARSFPSYLTAGLARTLMDTLGILLFEKNRWAKLGATVRGAVDGLAGQLGPRDPPASPRDAVK